MFRIAICDDLKEERDNLKNLLDEYFRQQGIQYKVTEYTCGENLIYDYEEGREGFNLIFMDIFMGGINGFETTKKIREFDKYVSIAFLTVSQDFAVDSYDVEASAYFLKPVDKTRLFTMLERQTRMEKSPVLEFRRKGSVRYYDYRDIVYIESSGHLVTLHLADGSDDTAYYKLDDLQLDDPRFLRCHKSYLVNMDFVKYAETEFLMQDGSKVPIRAHSRKELVDTYTRYFVKKHMGGHL